MVIYICLQLAVGHKSYFNIFRFGYETSLSNMAAHVRTEQNSPPLLKLLRKFSFSFLMNRHSNIQHDFKSIDIVRKQQHRNPPDNIKYTSAALFGCYRKS